ncbi:MAG: hypothetical protein JNL67_03410 [Planctomycetaceae bacterium]|nr:hypothetical protein [Planctomycetaceae bacterium]
MLLNRFSSRWTKMAAAAAACCLISGWTTSASAQFGLAHDPQLKTNFEFQPQTSFEPKLQTNFEPTLPTTFGFQATRSATNTRMKDRLQQLQPRLPEEHKFIAELIQLVEQGNLPEPVVNEAFFYSIQRYGGPMPFPYFERILRIQAERLKAQVPAFDRTVYSKERFTPQLHNR